MNEVVDSGSKQVATPDSEESTQITIAGQTQAVSAIVRWVGLVWIVIIGWWIGGGVGFVMSLVIVGLSMNFSPVVTVAFAHAGLLIILPELNSPTAGVKFGLFEIGMVAILSSDPPVSTFKGILIIVVGGSLTTLTLWLFFTASPIAATIILCCLGGSVGYTLHRYERVSLGLVKTQQNKNE